MSVLTAAVEESTAVVTVAFTDETGVAVVPTTITWSLRDENGSIINSRSAVSASPASSINIVLSGNDLIYNIKQTKRFLTVYATYTSTYGTGLPLNLEYEIPITPLEGVS